MEEQELVSQTPETLTAVPDILVPILERRRRRLAEADDMTLALRGEPILQKPQNNRFLAALHRDRGRAIIAEIKLGSPRLGSLVGRFEPRQLAKEYAAAGATALSVVVEPDYFFGSYELLGLCQRACGLPALAKDFIVDPLQLDWAKRAGASAVLLIASLYSSDELREYAEIARGLGLVPLVEIQNLGDLRKLADAPWELVGVNNRNLHTFDVELSTSMALLPSLPPDALKVSESGIRSRVEVARLSRVGYHAFLIGEALVTADDPAAKLKELRL